MSTAPIRIAMWSGPRNLSTAMMRSFGNRPDCAVVDEPFYAAYLAASGAAHPMREESLASQPHDWRQVAAALTGHSPEGRPVFYQKHMTHHMLPEFGRGWMAACRNAFLIRAPEAVLRSYAARREAVTLADIGFVQQREIFDAEAQRLGHAPPVIDAAAVRAAPEPALRALCAALGIEFLPSMLRWEPGRRATDGVWAPVWYAAVERSTGFSGPDTTPETPLPPALQRIADEARVHYAYLAQYAVAGMITQPGNR